MVQYGKILIARRHNANLTSTYADWKKGNYSSIEFQKYNIKETDFRIKTATFTSPQYLDLTTGQFIVLITSPYHENFAGIILDVEYDEKTKLYTYQCQDWSRKWISKVEIIGKVPIYRLLQWLITHDNFPLSRDMTSKELKSYSDVLSGLKKIGLYDQSLYKGNGYKGNPFKNKISIIARDKSFIEILRDVVYAQLGYFDVWINDRGVIQIDPISKTDWENTGLVLTSNGYYDRKFKFSTTNVITGVIVNGSDNHAGKGYWGGDLTGLNLAAFFGQNTTSISNPNTANKSNAVSSGSSGKNNNNTTMKNPFNNKNKHIIVSEDRGGTAGFKAGIIKKLKADGWSVNDLGTGPGTHSESYRILSKKYAVNLTIYNGADPETIKEPVTGWLAGRHEKYGVQLVQMWDTSDWTDPHGMKPYRYGDFTGYTCHKAWDDNYSGKSDAQATISDLGAWYKKYYPKVIHVCGPSVSEAYAQFKAGGYFKQKGIK